MQGTRQEWVFTNDQLTMLRDQGVIEQQIAALARVIPLCRTMWTDAAPLASVRDELQRLRRSLDLVPALVRDCENPTGRTIGKARREAYNRLLMALSDMGVGSDAIERLADVSGGLNRALADLPEIQRRPYSASARPVQCLDEALCFGWANRPLSSSHVYPHEPSINPTSPFRAVVCICYEAFTDVRDIDPERAIKAYLRQLTAKPRSRNSEVTQASDSKSRTAD